MQIQNPDVAQLARTQAKLTLVEGYPNNLLIDVRPVIDITPNFHPRIITKSGGTSASGATNTLVTTDANKVTKIHGVQYSIQKDSTCDAASGFASVKAVIGGLSYSLFQVPIQTLTAQSINMTIWFAKPIEVDKNSIFTITQGTFTVGFFSRVATFYISEE